METIQQESRLRAGDQCLLTVVDRHFMVDILSVTDDSVHVSFPGADYPPDGMEVELQFHDQDGFLYYKTDVLRGPREPGDGVVLQIPGEAFRSQHRASCRVPVDLPGEIRDQVSVKKQQARVIDLSAGGALIATEASYDIDTSVELSFQMPGEKPIKTLAEVVHTASPDKQPRDHALYGLRFISLDPESRQEITTYVWNQMKALNPTI